MGAPADTVNDATYATAPCFSEPDPLLLELGMCEVPLAWIDPMLEELAASLVMC